MYAYSDCSHIVQFMVGGEQEREESERIVLRMSSRLSARMSV